MTETRSAAFELIHAGISIIPVKADGTKAPAIAWKHHTEHRATSEHADAWFDNTEYGLGIVTGKVSGNLLMLEVEGAHMGLLPELIDTANASGLGQLWQTVSTGWVEQSPSGGMHWLVRLTQPPAGNQKLAKDTDGTVIAETRAEGGFVVAAPTGGTAHATGKPWARVIGGPTTVPTLDEAEATALTELFASLNRHTPDVVDAPRPARPHNPDTEGVRPGDDYNARAHWEDILEGWTPVKTFHDGGIGWRRPHKTDPGISATTGRNEADNLYVFSSSTEFEQEKAYSKFAAHTLIHHAGDYTAAARALKAEGYGSTPPQREVTLRPTGNTTAELIDLNSGARAHTNGSSALDTLPQKNPGDVVNMPVRTVTSLTDKGNADLLIQRHGHRLRYAPARGRWLTWDGARWQWEADDGTAIEAAWEVIESIDPDGDDQLTKHRNRSLSRRGLESMAALARRDTRMRIDTHLLDSNPDALNTPGGTIDLRTGELQPPDPDALHTKLTRTTPAKQDTPLWDAFLTTTFGADANLIAYVQRLIGYAATGRILHHVLPFLHGAGGNGKSVFLDTCLAILGDYATVAPADFLMRGQAQHPTELADLMGMRLVVCSEVNPGQRFDERKIKDLTGGEPIKARYMRQDFFMFQPTHTLFLMGNHQPGVESGGGESFWRRLRLLPFTRIIPEEERIAGLSERLIDEEAAGILQWIVDGAIAAQPGLADPDVVLSATEEYAAEEDALAQFVEEHINVGGGDHARVGTKTLRMMYARWCSDAGEKALSNQQLGRELRTRFDIGGAKSNGKRFYTNVTLLDVSELTDEEAAEHWNSQ